MKSMFDEDDDLRIELRRRGWRETTGRLFGAMMWRDKQNGHFSEEEAFAWLRRQLAVERSGPQAQGG